VLGSLEYAVDILTPLIMVLGHAWTVTAAVQGKRLQVILVLLKAIKPAISKTEGELDDPVDNAVVANVQYQIQKLKQNSNILSQRLLMASSKLSEVADLDTER